MRDTSAKTQVSAQGPERKNSPVLDDADKDALSSDAEPEGGVCYFSH